MPSGGGCSLLGEAEEVFGVVFVGVVVAESVERDEDDVVFGLLGWGVGGAVGVDYWRLLGVGSRPTAGGEDEEVENSAAECLRI